MVALRAHARGGPEQLLHEQAAAPAAGRARRESPCTLRRSPSPSRTGTCRELLGSTPVDRIQWTAPAVAQSVDRRVVVSSAQAGTLLTAVGRLGSGEST